MVINRVHELTFNKDLYQDQNDLEKSIFFFLTLYSIWENKASLHVHTCVHVYVYFLVCPKLASYH